MQTGAQQPQKLSASCKEALQLEAIEAAVELQVTPLAVAQVKHAGGDLVGLLSQANRIERGVVLHLGSRLIGHLVAAALGRLGDAELAQHPGQRRVAHRDAFLLGELFMHALDAATALPVKGAQQLRIDLLLVPAHGLGHLPLLGNDGAHRSAADPQSPGNLALAHAFLVEQEDCFTLVRFDHGVVSYFW
jgi:hypothetical protein